MEEQELKQEIVKTDAAGTLVVSDKESFELAGRMIFEIDGLIKKIKAYWVDPKKKAQEAHKAIVAKETEMLSPVEARRSLLAAKVKGYLTEQERIRREEQAKLDAARKKQEDAERAKLEARAEKAESSGKTDKAEELREKADAVFVAPAIVEPVVAKTTRTDTGTVSQKKDIEVRITDMTKVLSLIVSGVLPIGIVTISESKLKQHIKLMQVTKLDGCEITEVVNATFRGK